MINVHIGSMLSVTEKAILVHGCNTFGVMGSGIAVAIKEKYPKAFGRYERQHRNRGLKLGEVVPHFHIPEGYGGFNGLIIANAITQTDTKKGPKDEKRYANYWAIRKAFQDINGLNQMYFFGDLPVHFPLIGCGLANGDWTIVSQIIDEMIPDTTGKHLWILDEADLGKAMKTPAPSDRFKME